MKREIFHDIQTLSTTDLSHKYDLCIFDDGTVLDNIEDKRFNSLTEWANYLEDLQPFSPSKNIPIKTHKYWDDD